MAWPVHTDIPVPLSAPPVDIQPEAESIPELLLTTSTREIAIDKQTLTALTVAGRKIAPHSYVEPTVPDLHSK